MQVVYFISCDKNRRAFDGFDVDCKDVEVGLLRKADDDFIDEMSGLIM